VKYSLQSCLLLLFLCIGSTPSSAQYAGWKYSGSIYVLTTPEGADLPATASVDGFPLLVRLHKDCFDFSQAQAHGEDLRFLSISGETLAYQIEEWDALAGVASVWVRVPHLRGNARQQIKLYWGKADAASESNGKAVFNETNGYVSVWHMSGPLQDEVGTLSLVETGTSSTVGMIGAAKHFVPGQKGVFCGDKIPNYPSKASSHSTEAWFRAERPNSTIIGWGNEGGGRGSKVRMQFRSPPHLHIDSDFSDVNGEGRLPLGEWIHVVHTYDRQDGKIYINGRLDGAAKPLLDIKSPSRLWIGGWYHNYDFAGDIDEVRISRVARSADWIRLQYENQKPHQTLVGPLVQSGDTLAVSQSQVRVAEGKNVTISAQAGGAQKIYWILKRGGEENIVATDRFSYTFEAGRVPRVEKSDSRGSDFNTRESPIPPTDETVTLQFKAIYANDVKSLDTAIKIQEDIPEPEFTLRSPAQWDGRQTIEVVPQLTNLREMQAKDAGQLNLGWTVEGIAVIKQIVADRLILKRAQNSGTMRVSVAIDNGGRKVVRSITVDVQEPLPSKDLRVQRSPAKDEQPEDNQFFARDFHAGATGSEGTLYYNGTLTEPADSVFVRVYADDELYRTETGKLTAENTYAISVKLKPGLVKYRTEFGTKIGERETVLHTARNLVCGDVYLINGQSNAEATDIGKDDPIDTSDWIRSYGSTAGHPAGARMKLWANAVVRDRNGGKAQIGYWGLELAKRLVESQKMPICILNGAVGGSRIDQHQRNSADPTDVTTIYGRVLWRAQQARLTHGIRAVIWHQGENDQGADGPTGGYGWETYRQNFIELAAGWKEDFPNIEAYYVFQIWPKACSMGINGSDNQLREVQRTLPRYFSNLQVMSTLGIKPPGGCHFPKESYAEFARLICPVIESEQYHKRSSVPVTAPNLLRAFFASDSREELVLEFDQSIAWSDALVSQFYLDGEAKQIESGIGAGCRIVLKLKNSSKATKITYLDSAAWSPDHLLYGENGIAALTFCNVPIEAERVRSK